MMEKGDEVSPKDDGERGRGFNQRCRRKRTGSHTKMTREVYEHARTYHLEVKRVFKQTTMHMRQTLRAEHTHIANRHAQNPM